MTPTAARGVLDAIYWKPAITWVVDKIHVLRPIKFTNIRRNEIADVAKLGAIKKAMEQSASYDISSNDNRHQRAALLLKEVEYVIEAHFEINRGKAGESDSPEKHYNIALRRMRRGQFFHKPCLGTREFAASFFLIEEGEAIPTSSLVGEQDFGYMLYSLNYQLDDKGEKTTVTPTFFRAKTINGVCDLTKIEEVVS